MRQNQNSRYGKNKSYMNERKKQFEYRFTAADWIKQADGTVALIIPQNMHCLTGSVLHVRIGMQTANGKLNYHTLGIYRTLIRFIPNTTDIILIYPDQIGYSGLFRLSE